LQALAFRVIIITDLDILIFKSEAHTVYPNLDAPLVTNLHMLTYNIYKSRLFLYNIQNMPTYHMDTL